MARAASLRPILLYASESTGRLVLAAVGSIVLARYLGPASLGALGFVTSVFAILLPLATLGMAELVVRDLATAPEDRSLLAAALWALSLIHI